jgi:hypothetical protein
MPIDLVLRLFDRKTGHPLARASVSVVHKETRGRWVCLTGDTDDGRRIQVEIRSEVLEFVPPPASALPPDHGNPAENPIDGRRVATRLG